MVWILVKRNSCCLPAFCLYVTQLIIYSADESVEPKEDLPATSYRLVGMFKTASEQVDLSLASEQVDLSLASEQVGLSLASEQVDLSLASEQVDLSLASEQVDLSLTASEQVGLSLAS